MVFAYLLIDNLYIGQSLLKIIFGSRGLSGRFTELELKDLVVTERGAKISSGSFLESYYYSRTCSSYQLKSSQLRLLSGSSELLESVKIYSYYQFGWQSVYCQFVVIQDIFLLSSSFSFYRISMYLSFYFNFFLVLSQSMLGHNVVSLPQNINFQIIRQLKYKKPQFLQYFGAKIKFAIVIKPLMNSLPAIQDQDNQNDSSNGFSSTSFIPDFVHRQSVKKPSAGPSVAIEKKIFNLDFHLFTSITIFSPKRLKPNQFQKELSNFQYERVEKRIESQTFSKFGKGQQELFRQQQNLLLILTSVMRGFKGSKQNNFYILTKKSSRIFFFSHALSEKGIYIESSVTICNSVDKMAGDLTKQQIIFENVPMVEAQNVQKIVVKNQWINILWGWLLNKLLEEQKHFKSFTILTNFSFPGGSSFFPTQLFNGHQNKKQYAYIAKPVTNSLQQKIQEVFRMKISGLWTFKNIKKIIQKLKEMFDQKGFDIQFETDKISHHIRQEEE